MNAVHPKRLSGLVGKTYLLKCDKLLGKSISPNGCSGQVMEMDESLLSVTRKISLYY